MVGGAYFMAPRGATGGSEGEYSHFGEVALNGNIGGSQRVKYSFEGWLAVF
jgi:hypothetical protein